MKLIIAIIHDEDSTTLIKKLTEQGYGVTKLASTGGFLRSGNTTLLIGTEKEKVDCAIEMIKDTCKSRKEIAPAPTPVVGNTGIFMTYPIEVQVGGATIFVVDVDRFEKA
ncbi:cyclic-di-AMP receptor [Crassaminicella profunda]|uniref:cyclic-di-AMP receptor n=1 Tax=Crassaminicella profunda TaxID=1286698 RepID=UPI001CA78EB0|nr:cyclic-di-AMP receptor [Crassaminicella profunda]QZY55314.1 cyclic-di-AMP receptor [Crassaminicella profunda]